MYNASFEVVNETTVQTRSELMAKLLRARYHSPSARWAEFSQGRSNIKNLINERTKKRIDSGIVGRRGVV